MKIRVLIAVLGLVFTICAVAAMAQSSQPQPPGPPRDILGRLKSALQTAGAPTLTTEQESSILDMIQKFREAHRPPQGPPPDQGVEPSADQMAQARADRTAFAESVLNVLKGDQLSALVASLGEDGIGKLLSSLAGPGRGPHGGPGRGGPGFPGGPPPMGEGQPME
jgi:hypothetical protein